MRSPKIKKGMNFGLPWRQLKDAGLAYSFLTLWELETSHMN